MASPAIPLALIAIILGFLFAAWRAVVRVGRNAESLKHVKAEVDAKIDELEMHREATDIERLNTALSDADARAKAKRRIT